MNLALCREVASGLAGELSILYFAMQISGAILYKMVNHRIKNIVTTSFSCRLHDMCDQFMGELEEENIYAVFKKRPEDMQNFENYLCRGPETGLRGACSKLEGKRAKVEL
jgi:hypothetical protein